MRNFRAIFTLIGTFLLLVSCENSGSNEYIIIGTQIWATQNLDVSTFRNGDTIPEEKTYKEWKKSGDEQKPASIYLTI
jgi:hypothetical protein